MFFFFVYVTDMEGSFYNPNQLFVATKEPSVTYDSALAPLSAAQHQVLGIYQDEESIDFSALVEACEKTESSPITFSSNCSSAGGPLSGFYDTSEQAFTFDNLMPGLNTFSNDNNGFPNTPITDFTTQSPLAATSGNASVSMSSLSEILVGTDPAPGKMPRQKSGKQSASKKKMADKNSNEYLEKRERNNIAVRKSRIKTKQRVQETEQRVKELEDENTQLQSRITLLMKELNVLKSLFASAGVPHPPVKMESNE